MIFLREATASQEIALGVFVDETDGYSAEAGLTINNTDIKLWKSGTTTLASKNSGGATNISGGTYYAVLDATDTDTEGPMIIFVHVSGARPVKLECTILTANVYDSLIAGSDYLDIETAAMAAGVVTSAAVATGAIDADSIATDAITAAKIADGAIDAATFAANAINAAATAADFLAEINAEVADVLKTDTVSEQSQGVPTDTPTMEEILSYLYMALINEVEVNGTHKEIKNASDVTIFKKAVSDDGTTYTEEKAITGP